MGYNIDITSNNGNLTSKSFYLPENPAPSAKEGDDVHNTSSTGHGHSK